MLAPTALRRLWTCRRLRRHQGRVPFLHFFDGSHPTRCRRLRSGTQRPAEMVDWEATGIPQARRQSRRLNLRGSAQTYFQIRGRNPGMTPFPESEEYMNMINAKIGTDYAFNYTAPDAEYVLVAMGASRGRRGGRGYLRAKGKVACGAPVSSLPGSTCWRPPATVKRIAVLGTKEPGAPGEPLYLTWSPPLPAAAWPGSRLRRPLRPGFKGCSSRSYYFRVPHPV